MHIYEKGAILSNSEYSFNVSVLVTDIFELNTDLKAMMVVDIDDMTNEDELSIMSKISECNTFECDATAMGTNFRCKYTDIEIDADYANGSVVRLFMRIDGYEHYECKVINSYFDNIL